MSSLSFIPHHLYVSAASQPPRPKRKPQRDLLEREHLEPEAMSVSFEFLDDGKQVPSIARPLRVCVEAS
jgi:hypothetical protein